MFCYKHIFVLDIYCKKWGDICQLGICNGLGYILPTIGGYMYVTGRGVGECTLCDIYKLVSDIFCQQFGYICQLDICIGIGYMLPTFGGYMSVGGFLCTLRALGRVMYIM